MFDVFNVVGYLGHLFGWGRDVWDECFRAYVLPVIILFFAAIALNIVILLIRKRFVKGTVVKDDEPVDTLQRADEDEKPRKIRFGDSTAGLITNIVITYVFHFAAMLMIEELLYAFDNDMDRMRYYIGFFGLYLVYWLLTPLIFSTNKYMSWIVFANYMIGLWMQYYWLKQYDHLVDRIYSQHTAFLETLTFSITFVNITFFMLHIFMKKRRKKLEPVSE